MKKILALSITLCALFATARVFAATLVAGDAYISAAAPATNSGAATTLFLVSQGTPNDCESPQAVLYLKFDLSTVNLEVSNNTSSSGLLFTVQAHTLADAGGGLTFYGIAEDDWDEETITWENAPYTDDFAGATRLGFADITGTLPGTQLSFSSAALADFLNEQSAFTGGDDSSAGDNTASIVAVLDGCGIYGSASISAKEDATSDDPALQLYDPTAVTLRTIGATPATARFRNTTAILVAIALLTVTLLVRAGGHGFHRDDV